MQPPGNSIRVLHVDDDPDFVDVAANFVEREDSRFDIETATDASEGLDRLARSGFDCVVSDYEMPGRNGIEFLEEVRAAYPSLPFILFTGKGSEELASDAISAGVTDYFQKKPGSEQYQLLAKRIVDAVEHRHVKTSYREIFEKVPDGIVIHDPTDGSFTDMNEQYAEMYGYECEELLEAGFGTIHPNEGPYTLENARHRVREAVDGGPQTFEWLAVRKDGEQFWAEVHLTPTQLHGNERILAVVRDISERKHQEHKRQQIIDRVTDAIVEVDADWTFTLVNEQAEESLTMDEADLLGRELWEVFSEALSPRLEELFRDVMERREPASLVEFFTHVDRWFEIQVYPEDGGGLAIYFREVTGRIERTQELEQMRALLDHTEQIADVGGWEIDTETQDVFWTDHLFEMLGVDYETEPPLEKALDVYVEEDRPLVENAVEEALAAGESFDVEARFERPDGEIRWFRIQGEPTIEDDGVVTLRGAVHDITEHRERERKLRESEQRYRTLAEAFPNGIVTLFDADLRYTLASGRAFEYLPVSPEDVENCTPREVWGDAVGNELEAAFETALDGQEQSVEVEYIGRDWLVHVVPVTDDEGAVFSGMTMAQDITERKNREEEIADREQTLRSAYEIIADGDRSVSAQLDALLELGRHHLGTDYATFSHIKDDRYEFERVAVGPDIDLAAGETTDRTELPICDRVFGTGEPLAISDVAAEAPELVDPEWGIECYLGAPVVVNGESYGTFCFYDVESRSDPFSDWDQTFVELLSDWVGSELARRQTTEQLQRQNEQLEEFANVVSHDLRNPLNVAEGWLELAQEEYGDEYLKEIERAHSRMQTLIEDLLTLAREGHEVTEYTSVELSRLIDNCWATVETGDATLVSEIDRTVQADRSRVKQLFENLIRNAVEHGGDDVTVTVGELVDGFYIADDGPGIPEAERDDLFEAGFSTNTDGTGFGLSIAKRVAEAHNWGIQLSEGESGGARFEITGVEFAGK